ncbi:MAG: DUF4139 domain-containing protein [Campylobacteraceae bacterium]|nr:DUF4139 domain-containing protein [Campylobacteraceae bacterium]
MKKTVVGVCCLASFLFGTNTLDIYLDRAMISKSVAPKDKTATFTVPFEVNRADIDISSEILEFKFDNFRKIGTDGIKEGLKSRLEALRDSYELAKKAELSDLKEIESVTKLLENNLNEQRDIISKIELLDFTADDRVYFVKDLSLRTNAPNITIRYPLSFVSIYPKNIITTDLKTLKIKQNIIISGLREDIEKVDINFYPYNTGYGNLPGKFTPIYLRKEEQRALDAPVTMAYESAPMAKSVDNAVVEKAVVEKTIHSFNFWNVTGYDLKKDEENHISLNEQVVDANITNYIDGYATAKAYVMATFTPEFDVQEANSYFYIDDNFITDSYQGKLLKSSEAKFFFGLNNFIEVKKENVGTKSDDNFLGTKETTKTLKSYTITNNSDTSQHITFVERVPVSTHADIVVTVLGGFQAGHDGKVEKIFSLNPKESINFEFGYTVVKPIIK